MINNSMPLFNIELPRNFRNSVFSGQQQMLEICEVFKYNFELVRELEEAISCKKWVLAIIHGFARHISKDLLMKT
jgi:hypothetical protein